MTGERGGASEDARITLRASRSDVSPGQDLIDAFIVELVSMYGPFDPSKSPSASPTDMAPPGGAFLLVYDGERAVACGGLKKLDDMTGEIKRMYVVPDARGRGIARRLLVALEDEAKELGYTRVRLDTGSKQPHAKALYESAGYHEIPDYNQNRYASLWYEKYL